MQTLAQAVTVGVCVGVVSVIYLWDQRRTARRDFDLGYEEAAQKICDTSLFVTGGDNQAAISVVRDHAQAMIRYNEFVNYWKGVLAYLDNLEKS